MKTSIKALIAGALVLSGVSGCATYDGPVYRSYPVHRIGDSGLNYHWMPSERYSGGIYLYGGNRDHCRPQIPHREQQRVCPPTRANPGFRQSPRSLEHGSFGPHGR
ncbi:MAG: hypothetical protein WCI72_04175 [archaeon]